MAEDGRQDEEDIKRAFKAGDKIVVENLLPRVSQPSGIVVTFDVHLLRAESVSLLHSAAFWGWMDTVTTLVVKYGMAANRKDNKGHIPLHYAAYSGHLNIAQYLIGERHCDPSCRADYGGNRTPLHLACDRGHLNIVQYLIREEHCNPSCEDYNRKTPLHYACQSNQPHIVQYLLSIGRVNPLVEDKYNHTALYYASGKYDIIKLFEPFLDRRKAFPVHTFTKLILTGDSGAGKTTITELIVSLASQSTVEYISDVQRFTAGIIPHHIQSEQLGNFVVYDFGGQHEYYSSHSALLEQVMLKSPAIFICVVNLSEREEKVRESLHYWLSFIDNACSSTADGRSHVVIIGSHVDTASSPKEKNSLLQTIIATRRVRRQVYVECIAMDCRRANTDASRRLITTLTNSQRAITASHPVISYYSDVVYTFLRAKLDVVGFTLNDLASAIAQENDSSIPSDQSVLIEILTTLSDKGLILLIRNPYSSWVILKTETLLKEINTTLFAPDHFKEHRDLASNTGIVPVSNLCKVFPNYNLDMLVSFLMSLQFCRPVDPSLLQYTNLQTTPSHSTADLLFFPGLVQSERPDRLVQQGALKFGWCLKCMDPHEFFSPRFFHLLLLSIAFQYPLASRLNPRFFISGLQRMCTIWRNGIFWRDDNNTCTVIELLDNNRCVLVAMSCDDTTPVEHAQLRSSLIGLVRHLQQQYCCHLNVNEFLISPDIIQRYPLDNLPDTDLFHIFHVARAMLLHKKVVPSYKDSSGVLIVKALPFEPYHQLCSSSVCELFDPNMADQPVSSTLLLEVWQLCHRSQMKPQTYDELDELREHLDTLSLFAGRNPLVSGMTTVVCAW